MAVQLGPVNFPVAKSAFQMYRSLTCHRCLGILAEIRGLGQVESDQLINQVFDMLRTGGMAHWNYSVRDKARHSGKASGTAIFSRLPLHGYQTRGKGFVLSFKPARAFFSHSASVIPLRLSSDSREG